MSQLGSVLISTWRKHLEHIGDLRFRFCWDWS